MNTVPQFPDIETKIDAIWATPEGISLDQLIEEMNKLGNKVVAIDRQNNRLGLAVQENQ